MSCTERTSGAKVKVAPVQQTQCVLEQTLYYFPLRRIICALRLSRESEERRHERAQIARGETLMTGVLFARLRILAKSLGNKK